MNEWTITWCCFNHRILWLNYIRCIVITLSLVISVITINFYCQIIHLLNEIKIEYFTYRTKADISYCIAIRNLHLTTDINFIKEELSQNGFSVRNIQSKLINTALPIFFVDLDPAPNNVNIFKLPSLCYTKIKLRSPTLGGTYLSATGVRTIVILRPTVIASLVTSTAVLVTSLNSVKNLMTLQLFAHYMRNSIR